MSALIAVEAFASRIAILSGPRATGPFSALATSVGLTLCWR